MQAIGITLIMVASIHRLFQNATQGAVVYVTDAAAVVEVHARLSRLLVALIAVNRLPLKY